jgi:hypothetical protein
MSRPALPLATIVAAPCLSFGPLFVAIGFANQSVLDHACLLGGAVMVGAGLSAMFAVTARLDRRVAALEERLPR